GPDPVGVQEAENAGVDRECGPSSKVSAMCPGWPTPASPRAIRWRSVGTAVSAGPACAATVPAVSARRRGTGSSPGHDRACGGGTDRYRGERGVDDVGEHVLDRWLAGLVPGSRVLRGAPRPGQHAGPER